MLDRSPGDLEPAPAGTGGGGEGGGPTPDCVTSDHCKPASTLCVQPACIDGSCSYHPVSPGSSCENQGVCNADGVCKRDLGQPCDGSDACLGGACVDGICCDGLCDDVCFSCAVTGQEGACTPEPSGATSTDCMGSVCDGIGSCAAGELDWGKAFGGFGSDAEGRAVAPDGAGNAYLLVEFDYQMDFGGATLDAMGSDEVALVKLDGDGNELWNAHLQTSWGVYGEDVAAMADGGAVVAGRFYDGLDAKIASLSDDGSGDGWAVRFNGDGEPQWAQQIGGTGFGGVYELAPIGDEVLAGGTFADDVDFDGDLVSSQGGTDGFVVKMGAAGAIIWRSVFAGSGEQLVRGLAVDGDDIIVAGSFTETMTLAQSHTATGQDIYVARLDEAGVPQQSWSFGGAGDQYVSDLAVTPDGAIVITGYFDGTLDFGAGALPYTEDVDGFVVKLSQVGELIWAESFTGPDAVRALTVAVDAGGNVVVGGGFETDTSFVGMAESSYDDFYPDAFLVKLGPDGALYWHRTYGQVWSDETLGVAVDLMGHVYATGVFDESITIGQTFSVEGWKDVFALKLGP